MEKIMNNVIPFVDLKAHYIANREIFEQAMREVCVSSSYILGPHVERFEKKFVEYIGAVEAIGVASGTDALRLSCQAISVAIGDEVLVPVNTFIASALGVSDLGATVVPVDVDAGSFLMDMNDAEEKVTAKTKAIMPVHLYGQSMNMDALMDFAEAHNLAVIEDACQSHGAMWKGRRTGSFGSCGCFSFYPAKNLGAFGDGGIVTTNDSEIADKLRLLRNYGSVKKYVHKIRGTNSRLDSMQAAVLNVKMDFLEERNRKRFSAACRYADGLKNIGDIIVPSFDRNDIARHVFHLFVIQCQRRDELMRCLNDHRVQCGIHYPVPIHQHAAFESLGHKKGSFPVAEASADRILSLPMYPEITDSQIDVVINTIAEFYGQ